MGKMVSKSILIVAAALAIASHAFGQTNVKPMLDRLVTEAGAFEKLATQVTGQEAIHQRVLKKPQRHFRVRVGEESRVLGGSQPLTAPLRELPEP